MNEPVASALAASSGSAAFVFPAIIAVALIPSTIWLWTLVEVLSWPRTTWDATGLSKARWVMRILCLGIIGSVLYLRGPRRELRAAYGAIRWRAGDVP